MSILATLPTAMSARWVMQKIGRLTTNLDAETRFAVSVVPCNLQDLVGLMHHVASMTQGSIVACPSRNNFIVGLMSEAFVHANTLVGCSGLWRQEGSQALWEVSFLQWIEAASIIGAPLRIRGYWGH